MGIKKIREKKKQARKEKAKARVLARREVIRRKAKDEHAQQAFADLAWEDKHGKAQPHINDPLLRELRQKTRDEEIKSKLARNLEILQQLELEYEAEVARRKECNEKLEAEGCTTFKEKMDSLEEKAQAILEKQAKAPLLEGQRLTNEREADLTGRTLE